MTDDYQTLDFLMQGKAPGSVIVEQSNRLIWFTPYFRDVDGYWRGPDQDGHSVGYARDLPIWRPHVPPKKKVVRWQWALRSSAGWFVHDKFMTEEEASERRTDLDFDDRRKLPWTELAFDE